MLFRIRSGILEPCENVKSDKGHDSYVAFNCIGETTDLITAKGMGASLLKVLDNNAIRFESREEIDLFCFAAITFPHHQIHLERFYIMFGSGWLQIICEEDEPVKKLFQSLLQEQDKNWTLGRLLYRLFETLSGKDMKHLEYLEARISELEDDVMTGKGRTDYVKAIIRLRKHLMKLRRVYEQTLDLLEDLSGNENGLLDDMSLKYIKIYLNKIDRLYDHVGSLQEYVTEIREAYQAQVDINLNTIMKFFTVITSIFLPLTLVAGWYGMNLKMPEYGWEWGYPVVIGISILVVLAEILYFKKNKWF